MRACVERSGRWLFVIVLTACLAACSDGCSDRRSPAVLEPDTRVTDVSVASDVVSPPSPDSADVEGPQAATDTDISTDISTDTSPEDQRADRVVRRLAQVRCATATNATDEALAGNWRDIGLEPTAWEAEVKFLLGRMKAEPSGPSVLRWQREMAAPCPAPAP